ncbi:MAG: c-type cytochrome [Thermoleophilia bacterium]|nr:c-type cytochrome [Thermoleophilia bacterium]
MSTMRPRESYRPFTIAILLMIVGILVSFEVYQLREPARVAAEESRDRILATTAGRELFADNCAMCHGEQGEGVDGPPLNDSTFLHTTLDSTIFSVVGSGVPNTEMPAWNQAHGGPFTDEQIGDLVAFMRSWESTAPDRAAEAMKGDPQEGLAIYAATCTVCHGAEGQGTPLGPALNDVHRLASFDDDWYASTIADGRPAAGMPTWGTVLSPVQIRDLIALLRAWERGEKVELADPAELLQEAIHELSHGDLPAVHELLAQAADRATGELKQAIEEAAAAAESGDTGALEKALDRATELGGSSEDMGGMDMDDAGDADSGAGAMAPAPGEAEARTALADLASGNPAGAVSKLKVSLALASGPLKEAVEHALMDIEAGKADEARTVLEEALTMGEG